MECSVIVNEGEKKEEMLRKVIYSDAKVGGYNLNLTEKYEEE